MNRILIVTPAWIGDTVMMQPLLSRLHVHYPDCIIDALAPAWVAPLLECMPEIQQIIVSPFKHGALNLRERWRLGQQLRDVKYDIAITLPNSWKSALIPFFAHIPIRVGFLGEMRVGLINRIHRLDKLAYPRLVDRYALLAEAPGHPTLPSALPEPSLSVNVLSQKNTLAKLSLPSEPSPIIFCPGAEYGAAKRWPASYFAALAQKLAVTAHHPIWLLGSAKEATLGDEIVSLAKLPNGACLNLCGKTSLAEVIDLIACARLVISNDSGLMHVAAALSRPLIALFGSSSPDYTPPLSSQAKVLRLDLPCSPCFQRECPLGHFKCMRELTPDYVASEIYTHLK